MHFKDIHQSKMIRGIIIGLVAMILVLGIFKLGMDFGYRKARFVEHFGNNYDRNFVNPHEGFLKNFSDERTPPGGHGAVGKIVSIASPLIVVAGPDGIEKTIIMTNQTLFREFRDQTTQSNLRIGDYIVVLGTPNDQGQIEAKLIRTVPPPPTPGVLINPTY